MLLTSLHVTSGLWIETSCALPKVPPGDSGSSIDMADPIHTSCVFSWEGSVKWLLHYEHAIFIYRLLSQMNIVLVETHGKPPHQRCCDCFQMSITRRLNVWGGPNIWIEAFATDCGGFTARRC